MPAHTLADGLKSSSVNWETLHQNYNPLLGLVRELIGVVPNCDPILEIWPPGFRSYNLLVSNMVDGAFVFQILSKNGINSIFLTWKRFY